MSGMQEQFVCEPIRPVAGTMDVAGMLRGEPGLPQRFTWRGAEYAVAEVLETWKDTGPCRSGAPEQYVRKHWFRIRTTGGEEMKVYFDRQARSKRERKTRWWLHTVRAANGG
jgi:phosphoribosylglycinamide formyltransferase-1